jgi:hypothetical protein
MVSGRFCGASLRGDSTWQDINVHERAQVDRGCPGRGDPLVLLDGSSGTSVSANLPTYRAFGAPSR